MPVDTDAAVEGMAKARYSFEPNDDLDYDSLPDDWVRRKGPKFPRYVKIGIDCGAGCDGEQSLRFDANGGAAILYSPLIPIDALHTYRFRGKIRTKDLKQDAAVLSVSLLNHRRQRVQRFLTPAVTGTQDDWQTVELANIVPEDDIRFVSIGCHLLPGEEEGIGGTVWFDDLVLTQSPRMEIDNDFFAHFVKEDSPVIFTSKVSGLEPGRSYAIQFEYFDADGKSLDQRLHPLTTEEPDLESPSVPRSIPWDLGQQEPGYYRLTAKLLQDDRLVVYEETTLAVMQLVDKPRLQGEFGWSISTMPKQIKLENLVKIAGQAGINWVKFPVWNSVRPEDRDQTGELAKFFDLLYDRHIRTVGMLNDPPPELRAKFARNWLGVSEIFSTQNSVWGPSVEPSVARFSSAIRHWQLGDEDDSSFEGLTDLAGTLDRAYEEINRIGLNSQLGIPWHRNHPVPALSNQTLGFVSLRETDGGDLDELRSVWKSSEDSRSERWVLLQPNQLSSDRKRRAGQLVRQMLAAKMSKVDAVFINRVLEGRDSLLNPDGSPSDLFLPWRTMALALQEAEFLGEITFPQGSRNAVFARDGEAIIILWNDLPEEQTEEFYLGENVVETDLLGRTRRLQPSSRSQDANFREQQVTVTNTPKILRGCSESVARWRLATRFEIGEMRSEYGSHEDAVLGRNTFPLGVSGKVLLETPTRDHAGAASERMEADVRENESGWQAEPREWTITSAAGESFRLPLFLKLPTDANLGDSQMKLTFQITGDRPYRFQVLSPYHVGSGDVTLQVIDRKLDDGRLEIQQIVNNSTSPTEVLDFRCSLLVPGSPRQKARVTRLGSGEDRKFYFLDNADAFRGKELRLKLEQEGGGRILNHIWTVGADWEADSKLSAVPAGQVSPVSDQR